MSWQSSRPSVVCSAALSVEVVLCPRPAGSVPAALVAVARRSLRSSRFRRPRDERRIAFARRSENRLVGFVSSRAFRLEERHRPTVTRRLAPVSATVPDWSREAKAFWAWSPSRSLLASLRSHERNAGSRLPWRVLLRMAATLRHRFWSAVTGADIPIGTRIGGGLLLPHPNGVVLHVDAVIGPNCLIFQQVTIGAGPSGVPTLGGHVDVGAGAKVLGELRIGDHALIGANAVVLGHVAAGRTAVGIPATIVGRAAPHPPSGTTGSRNATLAAERVSPELSTADVSAAVPFQSTAQR